MRWFRWAEPRPGPPGVWRLAVLIVALLASRRANAGVCREVIPDEEIRCPFHPIDASRNDVVFVDLSDGSIRAASVDRPGQAAGDVVFDPFLSDLGWIGLATAVSPSLERALIMRAKPGCPPFTGVPGAGLSCSYGRVTLWLAYHDAATHEWVHLNLSHRGLGRNSEAHGWSTWLHRDVALFNALVYPDDAGWTTRQEDNVTQIFAVRFRSDRDFTIEPFAPARLQRSNCLTGRVSAQPSTEPTRCFDGQRVSFVRRCFAPPIAVDSWAWWNTRFADGSGGPCLAGQPSLQVPVLSTYVMELDASCEPKRSFEAMSPAHVPPWGPVYRQMGLVAEWGDMLSAISADGKLLAMATNMADPRTPDDNCGGFKINLEDPTKPLSGESNRNTHVCALDGSLRCASEPVRLGTLLSPPESTPLPGFVFRRTPYGFARSVVFSRRWSQPGSAPVNDVVRVDIDAGPDARVPLAWGRNAVAIEPIEVSPCPPLAPCRVVDGAPVGTPVRR